MKRMAGVLGTVLMLTCLSASAATYDGYTPAGTKLALGESAVLPLHIPYKGAFPIKVTVTAIERGSLDDFRNANLTVPEKMADMTPYYVRYNVSLVDMNGYTASQISGSGLSGMYGVDDRGTRHMETLLNGVAILHGAHFDKCAAGHRGFSSDAHVGSSYSTCAIYMVNQKGSIDGVLVKIFRDSFNNNPAYEKNPVEWVVSRSGHSDGDSDSGSMNW